MKFNTVMLKLICFAILSTLSAVVVDCSSRQNGIKSTYSVTGKVYIPYAELVEPFSAWFDADEHVSRVDYYGGMMRTFQLANEGEYGTSYEISPMTTDLETNVNTCFITNGTQPSPVPLQPVIPDLKDFKLVGSEEINGFECQKYRKVYNYENRTSTYTLWGKWEASSESALDKVLIPIKYEMHGYDFLLVTHYDHYYIEYDSVKYDKPDPEIFQVPHKMSCGGFPGPGKRTGSHFNPMQEFVGEYNDHVDDAWEDFNNVHAKTYSHHKEHVQRKEIFRQNLRFINSHNRKGVGYSLKVNHLADRSDSERKMLKGKQYTPGFNGAQPFPYSIADLDMYAKDLPDNFDWRILGAVTPVKDQTLCGSCWSFATTGTVEGAYFLKTGNLHRFSQQALVDCSWGYGNNGCDGGEDWRSYQWMQKHGGLPVEDDYGSYLGADGFCHVNKTLLKAQISGYVNVTSFDETALRLAISKHGPISVSIDASQKTFDFYSHGVYHETRCKSTADALDHSVLAIGYGILNGQKYWLIKNSWSNHWGNQGYVLMSSKDNNCGIMTSPTYVTLL